MPKHQPTIARDIFLHAQGRTGCGDHGQLASSLGNSVCVLNRLMLITIQQLFSQPNLHGCHTHTVILDVEKQLAA